MQANPIEGLALDGAVSYIDGDWSNIDPRVGNAVLLSDPMATPNWKWSAGIQYRGELGEAGSITPRFDISYFGRNNNGRIAGGAPIDYANAYTLANARHRRIATLRPLADIDEAADWHAWNARATTAPIVRPTRVANVYPL